MFREIRAGFAFIFHDVSLTTSPRLLTRLWPLLPSVALQPLHSRVSGRRGAMVQVTGTPALASPGPCPRGWWLSAGLAPGALVRPVLPCPVPDSHLFLWVWRPRPFLTAALCPAPPWSCPEPAATDGRRVGGRVGLRAFGPAGLRASGHPSPAGLDRNGFVPVGASGLWLDLTVLF